MIAWFVMGIAVVQILIMGGFHPVRGTLVYSIYLVLSLYYIIYKTCLKHTLYMMYVQKKHHPFKCSTVSISLSCFFNDVFFFKRSRGHFFRIPLDPLRWIQLQELKITEIRERISQKEGFSTEDLEILIFFLHHPDRNNRGSNEESRHVLYFRDGVLKEKRMDLLMMGLD